MDPTDPKTARKIYPHPNRLFAPLLLSRQRLCKGESFRAFCMHTSLHGWHYMVDRSARSPVNLHFSETISGVSTVRAFGAQDRFTAEFQVGKDYGPYQAVEFITFPLDADVMPC